MSRGHLAAKALWLYKPTIVRLPLLVLRGGVDVDIKIEGPDQLRDHFAHFHERDILAYAGP